MRRAGDLFPGVVDFLALCRAARRSARGKYDRPDVAAFMDDLEPRALALRRALTEGSWRPAPFQVFTIADPKPRTICAPPFADRVVHTSLVEVVGPVLERGAIHRSFACRVGKGSHAAVRELQRLVRRHGAFLKIDIRAYFASIDRVILGTALRRRLKDRQVLALLDLIATEQPPGATPGRGLAIGSLVSQHLANFYLEPLDRWLLEERRLPHVRYMDDLAILAPEPDRLRALLPELRGFLWDRLCLELRDSATLRAPTAHGVPFLGFQVFPRMIRLGPRARRRVAGRVRLLERWRRRDDPRFEGAVEGLRSALAHVQTADSHRLLACLSGGGIRGPPTG